MNYYFSLFLFCFVITTSSQENDYISQDLTINTFIDGTLLVPENLNKPNLAIIIADYGPTDRNGNQNFSNNNALKKLAESLTKKGIATFRYDKRIVKQILKKKIDAHITFDDFVTDVVSTITYFQNENKYSHIYIIGHGQGSLVGMLGAKEKADGFISIAGSSQPIDEMIVEQIGNMDPSLIDGTKKAFEFLKQGQLTKEYPKALETIFRADVQPFIMNWMQYKPQEVIKHLNMPTLIVNGTKDLQVSVDEARRLLAASEQAELKIIDNMNHVLFIIKGDELENSKSYNESFRPISAELITSISEFILNQ